MVEVTELANILSKFFGNYSKRELKRIDPICQAVLNLEDRYKDLSDAELREQTSVLKERLSAGETLDDILPDAFAVCREASARVLGMRHFPVQIIGGIVDVYKRQHQYHGVPVDCVPYKITSIFYNSVDKLVSL